MIHLVPISPDEVRIFEEAILTYLAEIDPNLATQQVAKEASGEFLNAPGAHAYWITHAAQKSGFALIKEECPDHWNLAEFSIFAQHRRKGLGRKALDALFSRHPGTWSLGVVSNPAESRLFWARCLAGYPDLQKGPPQTPSQCESYTFKTPER